MKMGKGDKRTKRGKMFRGSRGKSLPGKKVRATKTEAKPAAKPKREPREQPTQAPAAES
jgi:ribosomal small subunit protein bTHX